MATALIVGASRGLGRALVEEHLKRGWNVVATVRKDTALSLLQRHSGDRLHVEQVDITDWPAVDALRLRLEGRSFDLIFVNAGIGDRGGPIGDVEATTFTELLIVNAFAPLQFIDRFSALVPPGGTLAVMSSALGSIAADSGGGSEVYRISKAALNMGLRSIAARNCDDGRSYSRSRPAGCGLSWVGRMPHFQSSRAFHL